MHSYSDRYTFALPALILCQADGKNDGKKGSGEQAVRQAISDLSMALQNNDLAALDRIYADDYTFVSDTGTVTTKSERLGAFKSGDLKYETLSTEVLRINMFGDTAAAVSRITTKLAAGGKFNDGTFIGRGRKHRIPAKWSPPFQKTRQEKK